MNQKRQAAGAVKAGDHVGGQFAPLERTAAVPPPPAGEAAGRVIGRRYTSPSGDAVEAAGLVCAEQVDGWREAASMGESTIPATAARSAARLLADGESIEIVQQQFDHDVLHYLPSDLGPSKRRKRCQTCAQIVEPGTGRDLKMSNANQASAYHPECMPEKVRPPAPKLTPNLGWSDVRAT
ncbi:hypothetical protein [Leucobacter sp. cx-169]|uniref:hypothetical protein n=1 Tax=Leucobacter sp. cx-169 TaxID=2770549 RepID=UPI00165D7B98|nr:hypothetical protein [Leucobacter sp. cx-169]MBC9927399.1 hypothetical protein [Leucobacter sp. cx-169]